MVAVQAGLFGRSAPRFDEAFARLERLELTHGAWVDRCPGWLDGHEAIFDELVRRAPWVHEQRAMYDRIVDVPRLMSRGPAHGPLGDLVRGMADALSARYDLALRHVSMAYYRDGRDSVAWHGDVLARNLAHSMVCTVSVGEPRKFLLREKGGPAAHSFYLGWGDLCVMGGTIQRTWEHAVPKCKRAGPRIAIMFRPSPDPQDPYAVLPPLFPS